MLHQVVKQVRIVIPVMLQFVILTQFVTILSQNAMPSRRQIFMKNSQSKPLYNIFEENITLIDLLGLFEVYSMFKFFCMQVVFANLLEQLSEMSP